MLRLGEVMVCKLQLQFSTLVNYSYFSGAYLALTNESTAAIEIHCADLHCYVCVSKSVQLQNHWCKKYVAAGGRRK